MILAIKTHLSLEKLKTHEFYNEAMQFHWYNKTIHWYYFEMPTCMYNDKLIAKIVNDNDIIEHGADFTGLQQNFTNEVVPVNANFNNQWGLRNTGQYDGFPGEDARVTYAWAKETGSFEIVVAVVDSGIDVDHECLVGSIYTDPLETMSIGTDADGNGYKNDFIGWNTVNNNYKSYSASHGTAIASVITTNGNGMSGVAWQTQIMPIAIGDITTYDIPVVNFGYPCDNQLSWEDAYTSPYAAFPSSRVAQGITYAADKGAHIICVAYSVARTAKIKCCGTFPIATYMPDVRDAIKYAGRCGCIVVTAAGDNLPEHVWTAAREGTAEYSELCGNDDQPTRAIGDRNIFPGAYTTYFPHMINVTAMTNWGYLYYDRMVTAQGDGFYSGWMRGCAYSTRTCDIAAPGKSIMVAQPGDKYGLAGGTSVAAAFVAGAASLVWSKNPYLRNNEVVDIIKQTARRNDYWSTRVASSGVLDVNQAVLAAMGG